MMGLLSCAEASGGSEHPLFFLLSSTKAIYDNSETDRERDESRERKDRESKEGKEGKEDGKEETSNKDETARACLYTQTQTCLIILLAVSRSM